MRLADSAVNHVRFGVFEVDVRTREVRKTGKSVHLQEQPYRILEVLLRNPGQTVTREQFRREIWGDDVCVDFDRSLNDGAPEVLIRELSGWASFAVTPDGLYYATVDHGEGSQIRFLSIRWELGLGRPQDGGRIRLRNGSVA